MHCNSQLHVVLGALPCKVNEIMRESSPVSNQYSVDKDWSHHASYQDCEIKGKLLPFVTWKDVSPLHFRDEKNNQAMMYRLSYVVSSP
jgi:hypothetical protein